ncbi:hypothetical protein BDY19DRAFT_998321 [Irpex rosettiformis]|uniref:Uncharacterized protein n=1 Tax=Irpex rosettiformis TaxID=378272 RepID=A0ACB8TP21_9APHY|nr:hypothetical protein BDY19DRAFT_998321 [Irpex rosettiformis]
MSISQRRDFKRPAEERTHIYENPAISMFTNKSLYNARSRSPLGIRYSDHVGSHLTAAHIAFNLTMLEFALSEWKDGVFQDTTFTEDVGRKIYNVHRSDLESFETVFGELKLIELGQALVQNGRTYAGLDSYALNDGHGETGNIALSAFQRMAELSSTTTTDVDEGENNDNDSEPEDDEDDRLAQH